MYHDVTAAEPRRTLDVGTASLVAACAGGGGGGDAGDDVIVAPAAFLVRSWPDGCEERWRAKLEALAAGAQAGGAPPPNGGPVRRGWVAAAAHEQAVQLAAATAACRARPPAMRSSRCWGARWLEAAALLGGRGAFDDLIAQEPPPPRGPPEVGAEPPAPPLLRRWRRAEREWPCWLLAFAVPSEAALGRLAALSPLVEMGAGTAFWAAALARRGATVDCFDCDPPAARGLRRRRRRQRISRRLPGVCAGGARRRLGARAATVEAPHPLPVLPAAVDVGGRRDGGRGAACVQRR